MKVTRGRLAWVRRLSFAAVLIAAAVAPGAATSRGSAAQCQQGPCEAIGAVRWIRALPGSWVVQTGTAGTTPGQGQAYAALGSDVAAVGSGLTVTGYASRTGEFLWTTGLTGFAPGAAIMSVRVWPGVVTVGVGLPSVTPGASTGTGSAAAGQGPSRDEVVLRASTGQVLRRYQAAQFGGAADASTASTVIVGDHSVARYANHTGKVLWSRATGPVPQAWQVDAGRLYMTEADSGSGAGGGAATELRRIDLRTGAERMIRAHGQPFTGVLSLAFDGVLLFSGPGGARAYSETTGELLWSYPGALPDTVDAVAGRFYLTSGGSLIGVDPATGHTLAHVSGAAAGTSSGLYAVREGNVLGIDHGAVGKAWGYDVAAQQVLWTSRALPWPHFFVDLSGIGGSAPPDQDAVLLAICAQVGAQPASTAPPRCARPEIAVLNR